MNEGNRRLGDSDFHVLEEITLDDTHIAHHSGFHENPKQQTTNPEIKFLLQNISNNENYYSIAIKEINYNTVENGDIVEIKFIKDYKQKDIFIVLRFFIKMKYTSSMLGFIYILDEANGFESKARAEKLSLPIISGGKRKVTLLESKSEAIIIATNQFFHEMRIKELKIYKPGKKVNTISGFFKEKIGALFKR